MNANINALGIISSVIITLLIIIKFGQNKWIYKNLIWAIPLAVIISYLNITFSYHKCLAGNPIMQWLIPMLCLIPISLSVKNKLIALTMISFLIVISFSLSNDFVSLVHTNDYTGNPKSLEIQDSYYNNKDITYKLWHTHITGLYGEKRE